MNPVGLFGGFNLGEFKFIDDQETKMSTIELGGLVFGKRYIDKFVDERFVHDDFEKTIFFDGFIFNIESNESQKDFVLDSIERNGIEFFLRELDGVFSFCMFSKDDSKLYLATDHLSTRKLFYCFHDQSFIFSSNLKDITRYLKDNNSLKLSKSSVYGFLGFGSYISNTTPFENVYKLEPLTLLEISLDTLNFHIRKYDTLSFSKNDTLDFDEVVDCFEKLISEPVNRICNLNDKYGFSHISTLSGGLDSKSVFMLLSERYQQINSFTFAEFGSLDQSIPQNVSSVIGSEHTYVSLDNGLCLEKGFDDVVSLTGGMISLHTILHSYNSFIKLDFKSYGLMLTGQIGDAIFGSHFIGEKSLTNYITSKSHCGNIPNFILTKIDYFQDFLQKYTRENVESYIYEGRIACGTVYGDLVVANQIDCITPFYSKKLLKFAVTVDDLLRKDDFVYIEWLRKYHSKVLEFKLDKCNCKPTSITKVKVLTYINTVKNAIRKRLKLKHSGMNPFDKWYRDNPRILDNLDKLFNQLIQKPYIDDDLRFDISSLYDLDLDRYKRNKFAVITLLLSLQLHYEK